MVLQTHVLPTFIPVTGLRNPPLWFRGSVIDPSSRDGPGLRHLLSLSRPPNPPPLLSECFIWALLNLQHQTVSAHFLLPSTRKCRFYNSQSPPSYEWRSGKQQEMAESVDCVVWLKTACWSSLLWCFEKRWRHGWLKTAAGTYFAPRALCWYSQRWFIN